jgi:hypothetical protein
MLAIDADIVCRCQVRYWNYCTNLGGNRNQSILCCMSSVRLVFHLSVISIFHE